MACQHALSKFQFQQVSVVYNTLLSTPEQNRQKLLDLERVEVVEEKIELQQ